MPCFVTLVEILPTQTILKISHSKITILTNKQRLTGYSHTGLIQQRTRRAKVHETESEAGGKESALGTLGREKNKGPPLKPK